jgi:2-alkyl-3-oxoalkanoate reductase
MRILLTGASGEIGTPLISRLAEQRHELHAISRRERPEDPRPVRWIGADLRDAKSLVRACQCEPDVVVHMAAVTHSANPSTYEAVNVQGTASLVEALSEVPLCQFIHLSTRAIGARGGAYSASKERAERVVTDSNLPWTILRPAEVYGSGGSDPILSLAADLRRRRFVPILGDGSHRLSPVLAGDVVDALIHALESEVGRGETYVLAGPEEVSYLELVAKLEAIQGLARRRRIRIPITMARVLTRMLSALGSGSYVPDQIPRLLLSKSSDSSAALRDLQFDPKTLDQALPSLLEPNPGR